MSDKDLRDKLLAESTAWLLEMELLDSPQLKNFLILNIYNSSSSIKNVELLIDTHSRAVLIYLEVTLWGRIFRKHSSIAQRLMRLLAEVLPSFRIRIIFSKTLFNMALHKAEKLLHGKIEKKKTVPKNENK